MARPLRPVVCSCWIWFHNTEHFSCSERWEFEGTETLKKKIFLRCMILSILSVKVNC